MRGSALDDDRWVDEIDVAVIGFGAAGAMAAIEAHDAGARVAIFEKMLDPGGLSIVSAGGIRVAFDKKAAYTYLKESCGGRTPDDLLDVLADGMTTISTRVEELAKTSNATVKVTQAVANYPSPAATQLGYCEITNVPGDRGRGFRACGSRRAAGIAPVQGA